MERKPVTSKFLRSVGYDAAAKVLEVELCGGKVYRYAGVSEAQHAALMKSESAGKYFLSEIKPGHPCTRVGG